MMSLGCECQSCCPIPIVELDVPCANEIERCQHNSSRNGGGSSDEQRDPRIGGSDINQSVNVVLYAKVRHIEDRAQEAP